MRNRLLHGSSTMLSNMSMSMSMLFLFLSSSSSFLSSSLLSSSSDVLIMVGIDRYGCHLKRAKRFGFRMWGGTRHFSFLQTVQNDCESLSFLFNGYQNSFPGVKRQGRELAYCPRSRMSGALPLLPQHAFMAWISTGLPFFIFSVSEIQLGTV